MKPLYLGLFIILAIALLYISGGILGEQCISVGAHRACWKTVPVQIKSELCPSNSTCTAEPYIQQHNAIVDVLLLSCDDAKKGNYADVNLNE